MRYSRRVKHPLKTYLQEVGLTAEQFAAKVRACGSPTLTASYLSQIIIGYRHPSRALAISISHASEGAVSVGDLMEFDAASEVSPFIKTA